jgi:hypothetical protein
MALRMFRSAGMLVLLMTTACGGFRPCAAPQTAASSRSSSGSAGDCLARCETVDSTVNPIGDMPWQE